MQAYHNQKKLSLLMIGLTGNYRSVTRLNDTLPNGQITVKIHVAV